MSRVLLVTSLAALMPLCLTVKLVYQTLSLQVLRQHGTNLKSLRHPANLDCHPKPLTSEGATMRQFFAAVAVALCATSVVADSNTATAQNLLNQLGLDAGPVDGSWGPRTGRAIDRFYTELGTVYDGSLDAQDISELEAAVVTYRHFGNRDWSPEIRTDLHDIDISTASFDYISDNLIAGLVPFQQFREPDLGMQIIGEPPDVEFVRRPMDVDCLTVLRNMSPPDMRRWDAPLYAQNCNYHYRQKIFGGGIDVFQDILNHWAAQPLGIYDLEPGGHDSYFKSTLMASVGTTYALFYDLFDNHAAIDNFITDWMLNNQTLVGRGTCPFSAPENFTPNRYSVDSCGSNHWRLSVANVALGLRLGDRQLFIAGVKHLEINLSMYDVDDIFTPYATRGWDSPGYAVDNNEYITSIALMLAEVDVNLYDLKIHDGRDIGALIEGHNAWLTDPSLAKRYLIGSNTCNGGSCTRINSMAALGPLDQWKVDRQFEDFDILLRSFHYQVTEKGINPIDLARMFPSDRGDRLPGNYVWGQTSAFPYIYATLEHLDALEGYLKASGMNIMFKLNTSDRIESLNWYTALSSEGFQKRLQAQDTLLISEEGNLVSSSHVNLSDDGIGGRQGLTYSFQDNAVIIQGTVTVLGDEQVFINVEELIETGKATIIFGPQDKLIISWTD